MRRGADPKSRRQRPRRSSRVQRYALMRTRNGQDPSCAPGDQATISLWRALVLYSHAIATHKRRDWRPQQGARGRTHRQGLNRLRSLTPFWSATVTLRRERISSFTECVGAHRPGSELDADCRVKRRANSQAEHQVTSATARGLRLTITSSIVASLLMQLHSSAHEGPKRAG